MFLAIDRNMGVIDSLQTRWQITEGERMKLFLVGLIAGAGATVVMLLTCCIGIILVYPVVYTGG